MESAITQGIEQGKQLYDETRPKVEDAIAQGQQIYQDTKPKVESAITQGIEEGKQLYDETRPKVESAIAQGQQIYQDTKPKIEAGIEQGKESLNNAAQTVSGYADYVQNTVIPSAQSAVESGKQVIADTIPKVEDAVAQGMAQGQQFYDETRPKVEAGVQNIVQQGQNAVNNAAQTVSGYADYVQNTVIPGAQSAVETGKQVIADTIPKVEAGIEQGKQFYNETRPKVEAGVQSAIDTAKEAAGKAKDAFNAGKNIVYDAAGNAIQLVSTGANMVNDSINYGKELVDAAGTVIGAGPEGLLDAADYLKNGGSTTPGTTTPGTTTPGTTTPGTTIPGTTTPGSTTPGSTTPGTTTPGTTTPGTTTPGTTTPSGPSVETPDGALSYSDYLAKMGSDPAGDAEAAKKKAQEAYNKSVLDASREYDRARAAYGAEGEAMARAGLTGSGYADYLDAQAYAARQGSMDAARGAYQNSLDIADASQKSAERELQRGYLDYIENYKAGQKADFNSAMSYLINGNISGAQARSYLEMMGLGDRADSILAITDPIVQKNTSSESHAQASKWLDDTLAKGYTGQDAYDHAKFLGASDEEAAYIQKMADAQAEKQKGDEDKANRVAAFNAAVSQGATTYEEAYKIVKQYISDEELAKQIATDAASTASSIDARLKSENASERAGGLLDTLVSSGLTDENELADLARSLNFTDEAQISSIVKSAMRIRAKMNSKDTQANKQGALEYVVSSGLTGKDAKNMLITMYGYTAAEADAITSISDAIISGMKSEDAEVRRQNAINALISTELADIDSLKSFAKGLGLSEAEAESAAAAALLVTKKMADDMANAETKTDTERRNDKKLTALDYLVQNEITGDGAISALAVFGFTGDDANAIARTASSIISANEVANDEAKAEADSEMLRANIGNALSQIISLELTGESAKNYAKMLGYSDADALSIQTLADQYASGLAEDQNKDLKANVMADILAMGYRGDAARAFAKACGLNDSEASGLVSMTDSVVSSKTKDELARDLPAFMAEVLSQGWDADTAKSIATAMGYDEEALSSIESVANQNSTLSTEMSSALASVLNYNLTGSDARSYMTDVLGLSAANAAKVQAISDRILGKAESESNMIRRQDAINALIGTQIADLEQLKDFAANWGLTDQSEIDAAAAAAYAVNKKLADDLASAEGKTEAEKVQQLKLTAFDYLVANRITDDAAVDTLAAFGITGEEASTLAASAKSVIDSNKSLLDSENEELRAQAEADYLRQNKGNVLSDIIALGYTGDQAKLYATEAGYSAAEAANLAALADSYASNYAGEKASALKNSVMADILNSGYTYDAAYAVAKAAGLTEAEATELASLARTVNNSKTAEELARDLPSFMADVLSQGWDEATAEKIAKSMGYEGTTLADIKTLASQNSTLSEDMNKALAYVLEYELTGDEAKSYMTKVLGLKDTDAATVEKLASGILGKVTTSQKVAALDALISAGSTAATDISKTLAVYGITGDAADEVKAAATAMINAANSAKNAEETVLKRQSAVQALIGTGETNMDNLKDYAQTWAGLTDQADIDAVAAMACSINTKNADADAETKKLNAFDYLVTNMVEGDSVDSTLALFGVTGDDAEAVKTAASNIINLYKSASEDEENKLLKANIGNTLSQIVSLGLGGNNAKEYAKTLGYSDEDAFAIAQLANKYYSNIEEEEGETLKLTALGDILSLGLRGEGAQAYARALGLSEGDAAALASETDTIISQKSAEELQAGLPSFLAQVISYGWTEDQAQTIAEAAGYSADALTEIINVALSGDADTQRGVSDILTMGLTGEAAKGYLKGVLGYSALKAESVMKITDEIFSQLGGGAEEMELDFTATEMEISDFAEMYKLAAQFAENGGGETFDFNGSGYTQDEADAIRGGADKLDDYLRLVWKSKGYTSEEIIEMLALVKEYAAIG